jgi:hypothetical protein
MFTVQTAITTTSTLQHLISAMNPKPAAMTPALAAAAKSLKSVMALLARTRLQMLDIDEL